MEKCKTLMELLTLYAKNNMKMHTVNIKFKFKIIHYLFKVLNIQHCIIYLFIVY